MVPGFWPLTGDSEWVEAAASLFAKRLPIKAAFDAYSPAAVGPETFVSAPPAHCLPICTPQARTPQAAPPALRNRL